MGKTVPVVLVGNDVHLPIHEMAARQIASIRDHFRLPADQVISLQSRKPRLDGSRENVITGTPVFTSRSRQLMRLFQSLHSLPIERSRIVHFVGNGNITLRYALSLFASLTGRAVVFSPLGKLRGPWPGRAKVLVSHSQLLPKKNLRGWQVLPPIAPAPAPDEGGWGEGRLLFCSIPPKERELAERGVPFLIEAFSEFQLRAPESSLTILNRYPWMDEPLKKLARKNERISIQTEVIADMERYFRRFAAVILPSQAKHLAQVPQSALEACALGIPCIVSRHIALSAEIEQYHAGIAFSDASELVAALIAVRNSYARYCSGGPQLINEGFQRDISLALLGDVYRQIDLSRSPAYGSIR